MKEINQNVAKAWDDSLYLSSTSQRSSLWLSKSVGGLENWDQQGTTETASQSLYFTDEHRITILEDKEPQPPHSTFQIHTPILNDDFMIYTLPLEDKSENKELYLLKTWLRTLYTLCT